MSKCHPVYLSKVRENRADGGKEGSGWKYAILAVWRECRMTRNPGFRFRPVAAEEVLSGQLVRTCQPEGETAGKKSAGFCKRSGFIQKEKPV